MSLIKNLYREYKEGQQIFTLDIPRWELPDVGVMALMGASGSGKTSLLRIMAGLDKAQPDKAQPDETKTFEWQFESEDLAKLPTQKRKLGVVFQSYDLFQHMTVEENILFALKARNVSEGEAKTKLENIILDLDLTRVRKNKAVHLSGGERQRVALARALVGEPRFLLLDEPFSALDEDLKNSARQTVKKIIDKYKVPTLLITHDIRDVEALATHVSQIVSGKIAKSETRQTTS